MCSLTEREKFPQNGAMSLLGQTQELLTRTVSSGVSLRQIAEESDGTVVYEWLKKLSAGKIEDPGVSKIEALNKRLLEIKKATRSA